MNEVMTDPTIPQPVWSSSNNSSQSNVSEQIPEPLPVAPLPSKIDRYSNAVLSLTPDETFLDSVCKLQPFNTLPLQCLFKICKRFGIKKYTTMNKDSVMDALNKYRARYNNCHVFRFTHYFSQNHCNAPGCKATKTLRSSETLQWKYCDRHITKDYDTMSVWEKNLTSSFTDLVSGAEISMEESNQQLRGFYRNTNTVPFIDDSKEPETIPLQPSNDKKPRKNIRTLLQKGKISGLSKQKFFYKNSKSNQCLSPTSSFGDNDGEGSFVDKTCPSEFETEEAPVDVSNTFECDIYDDDEEQLEEDCEGELDDENNNEEEEEGESSSSDESIDVEEGEILSPGKKNKRNGDSIIGKFPIKYPKSCK